MALLRLVFLGVVVLALNAVACAEDAKDGGTSAPGRLPTYQELAPKSELPSPGDSDLQDERVEPTLDGEQLDARKLGTGIDLNRIDLDLLYTLAEEREPDERINLSIEECIQLALKGNQDIVIASYAPIQAEGDVLAAHGILDPVLSGSATHSYSVASATSQIVVFGGIQSIESDNSVFQGSLNGLMEWSAKYSVSTNLERDSSTFNGFVPEYSGGLTLTLTQPLLRGRGKTVTLARVTIAENSKKIAEHQVQLAVMSALAQVISGYWDLVGAVEALDVREKSMENAEQLLFINEKRLDIGTAAALEVLQAKAGVASRKSEIVAAGAAVANAGDRLKSLLNLEENGVLSKKRVVPVTRPNADVVNWEDASREWNEEESVAKALEQRPEMYMAELEIESAKVETRRASNAMLPQFDLNGSLFQGGRDSNTKGVFEGVIDRSDNTYLIGAQGSIPLGNRTARGTYYRAKQTEKLSQQRLAKAKQDLILNVRLALRAVQSSRVLVESNRQARALQEANLEAEQKRLKLGATTSYRVLQVEEQLTLAELQESQALIDFEKSVVNLRVAEGALLTDLGVEFQAPEAEPVIPFGESLVHDLKESNQE